MDDDLDDDEVIGEVAKAAFSDITGSIVDTHSAVTVLAITMTAEICGLGMLWVVNDKVRATLRESDVNVWFYVSAAVFVVGFLNAFAIYSLIANKWPHSDARLNNWLVGIGGGLLNLILFFLLTTSVLR